MNLQNVELTWCFFWSVAQNGMVMLWKKTAELGSELLSCGRFSGKCGKDLENDVYNEKQLAR